MPEGTIGVFDQEGSDGKFGREQLGQFSQGLQGGVEMNQAILTDPLDERPGGKPGQRIAP